MRMALEFPAHAVSASAGACLCFSEQNHYDNRLVGAHAYVGRAEYRFGGRYAFVGFAPAFESVLREGQRASVFLIGPSIGLRGGNRVRGALRLSGGYAYAYNPWWGHTDKPANVDTSGWYFDIEGEIGYPFTKQLELVFTLAVLNARSFVYPAGGPWNKVGWYYFSVPIVPTMITSGVRLNL
jgi:hypothetical protein